MDDTSKDGHSQNSEEEKETYPLDEEKTLEIISLIFLLVWITSSDQYHNYTQGPIHSCPGLTCRHPDRRIDSVVRRGPDQTETYSYTLAGG